MEDDREILSMVHPRVMDGGKNQSAHHRFPLPPPAASQSHSSQVTGKTGTDASTLPDRPVRLRFELRGADFFAFRVAPLEAWERGRPRPSCIQARIWHVIRSVKPRLIRIFLLVPMLALGRLASTAAAQPPASGWSVAVGGGMLVGPAFPGASDYQLMVVPSLRVRYGEKFSASVEQGITYALLDTGDFSAGPLLRVDFGREANGKSLFRVAGKKSTALTGFADVPTTLQAGVFVSHRFDHWVSRLELLQGVNGHEGFTGTLSTNYAVTPAGPSGRGAPAYVFTTGPRLHWGGSSYNDAYFGVSPEAARLSGLKTYRAGSGLTSAGWSANYVRPIDRRWSLVIFGGYERLLGDAANSPLVREKGSKHQTRSGVFVSYTL